MGDGPRRRRANAWVWVSLALFGPDDEGERTESRSTDPSEQSDPETSDGSETR